MDWIQFYLQMECLKLALPCIQQFKNQYKSLGRALDATRHSLQVKNIHMSDDPREDLGKFKYFSNSDGWCGLCKNFMFCFLWSKCKYTVQTTKRIESPPCAWNDQLWHNGIYFLFHLRARRDSANFKRSWVVTFSFRFASLASKTWELMACKDVRCSWKLLPAALQVLSMWLGIPSGLVASCRLNFRKTNLTSATVTVGTSKLEALWADVIPLTFRSKWAQKHWACWLRMSSCQWCCPFSC